MPTQPTTGGNAIKEIMLTQIMPNYLLAIGQKPAIYRLQVPKSWTEKRIIKWAEKNIPEFKQKEVI